MSAKIAKISFMCILFSWKKYIDVKMLCLHCNKCVMMWPSVVVTTMDIRN